MADPDHWNDRYDTVGAQSVSWYQDRPTTSLDLLDAASVSAASSVIDVGGGASNLVDHLLERGHGDVTVLDLSDVALAVARDRIGDPAAVTWIAQDLLSWAPPRTWDVWHDRAVLHFLLVDEDRVRYVQALRNAVLVGGTVIIGAFAEDGPTECSLLPVRRQAPGDLRELLGDVDVLAERREVHTTPGGGSQPFNWIAARLR